MNSQILLDHIGKSNGHYGNKHNRARKLIDMWPYLEQKMITMIERGSGVSKSARCAYAILLMMETGIRIGNESSAEGYKCENKYLLEFGKTIQTYGLTTLKKQHVKCQYNNLILDFVGKKGVQNRLQSSHYILIKYHEHVLTHDDTATTFLNIDYLTLYKFVKKYIGRQFKPKDIRTAKINILYLNSVSGSIHTCDTITRKKDANAYVKNVIITIAEQIAHTPSVCKSAYLSPKVVAFTKEHLYEIILANKKDRKTK